MEPTIKSLVLHIAASSRFQSAPRLAALLQYLADAQEAGATAKEYAIGVDVLERPADFDPRLDSIVRVHVSRLRQRLNEYYSEEGRHDAIRIELPKGDYRLLAHPPAVAEVAARAAEVIGNSNESSERSIAHQTSPVDAIVGAPSPSHAPLSESPAPASRFVGRRAILAGLVTLTAGLVTLPFFLRQPLEASVSYIGMDQVTRGTWTGVYGADGQIIPNYLNNPPSYAKVAVTGATTFTWWARTTDSRALQYSSGSSARIASQFYPPPNGSKSFTIAVNLTDGKPHRLALYLCDWDTDQRDQSMLITDSKTNRLLDTRSYHNFQKGMWVVWNVKGSVTFEVRGLAGINATVNGIFFGDPSGDHLTSGQASTAESPALAPESSATKTTNVDEIPNGAAYVGTDTATQGNWTGVYGSAGRMVPNSANDPPNYAIVTFTDTSLGTWAAVGQDRRALQDGSASVSRIASRYFPSTPSSDKFSIHMKLTDRKAHRVALYLCDWDRAGLVQRISLLDAATNRLLDARKYSELSTGTWAVWNIKGEVIIEVRGENGIQPAISGIFFQ